MRLERFFSEPGADFTNRLVRLGVGVITREQEGSVYRRAFALPVEATDDNQVERITDSVKVVFFQLQGKKEEGSAEAEMGNAQKRIRTLSQLTLRRLGS